MMAPFGTRTGSEGAVVSNVQVGHDGERQFLVHPESRKAMGVSGAAVWASVVGGAAERQAWGATTSSRLHLVAPRTPSPCQGRYS